MRRTMLLMALLAAAPASGQTVGPASSGRPAAVVSAPSLGAALTSAMGAHVRFGVGASRQATRLEVTDETGATSRTHLVVLHLHLDLELAFGGGAAQPLLTVGGGGMQARAEDGSGE